MSARRFVPLLVLTVIAYLLLASASTVTSRAAAPPSTASPIPATAKPVPAATVSPRPAPPTPAPTVATPLGSGYWHTSGTRILDARGRLVRIAAVTWYGMESTYWVPAGLNFQPYTTIMDLVKRLGYNAIRLPYSDQLVATNPIVTSGVKANPWFKGMHALSVMDAIVGYAYSIGLKIILDDHRSRAATPLMVNNLDEALWYTNAFPESTWLRNLRFLAARYRGNDAVIGIDLRNEPHTAGPGPWSLRTYLRQGATWGPFMGYDNTATDWRLAAERGGNAVLGVNPHLLVFVEGVQMYPDSARPDTVDTYWWGSILRPVAQYPVVLKVPHQLVYSAHEWGPHKTRMPWFNHMTYQSLLTVWNRNWGYLIQNPKAPYAAPVFIGEFGTCTDYPYCLADQKYPQAQWFAYFLQFLRRHPAVGWDFWALNGTNSNDSPADNGVLNPHWTGVANVALQKALASVQP